MLLRWPAPRWGKVGTEGSISAEGGKSGFTRVKRQYQQQKGYEQDKRGLSSVLSLGIQIIRRQLRKVSSQKENKEREFIEIAEGKTRPNKESSETTPAGWVAEGSTP